MATKYVVMISHQVECILFIVNDCFMVGGVLHSH
jgi:hypothetical protein